jgi:hypothetical protein
MKKGESDGKLCSQSEHKMLVGIVEHFSGLGWHVVWSKGLSVSE